MGFGSRIDGCAQFSKYCLIIANLIIFVGGLVAFGISLWTLIDRSYVNELLGTDLYAGAVYVLLITSWMVCMVALLGCIGAAKEVKCLLLTYFIIILIIFVTMLIGGILGYVFREKVVQTMKQEMRSSLKFYGNRREVTQAWDATQERLKCCGIDRWNDWFHYQEFLPESCCQEIFGGQKKPCSIYPVPQNLYTMGCYYVAKDFIRDHAAVIGGTGITVAILMILGMIFSGLLFNSIE